jgi:hypothetical protein
MKLICRNKMIFAAGIFIIAWVLAGVTGCVVRPDGRVGFQPVVVAAPAPPPAEPAAVPDDYVWDGYEYVGVVGDQYFYLGPGNVWLLCEPFRLERFHGWERDHADWRAHAIRNDRFRRDAHGQEQPRHDRRRDEH